MVSAIYLLGERPEVAGVFDLHIQPYLTDHGITVPDRTMVPLEQDYKKGLLFSLVGDNLEVVLSEGILDAFHKTAERQNKEKFSTETDWEYSLRIIRTTYPEGHIGDNPKIDLKANFQRVAGPFSDPSAASQLFVPIALEYFHTFNLYQIEELQQRLEEIASSTIASFGK
jgi:hypothetical protein